MASVATEGVASGPPLLQVRGLTAGYGPVVALDGVDLDVRPGETIGVAGDNGAGKSTLLRCLSGELDGARGEVRLDGRLLGPSPAADLRGLVGVVWQHLVLPDNLDVAAALMLGREQGRLLMTDVRAHARARVILDDLGIAIPDTTRPVGTLTTGQRHLLAIARAVSPRPRLLLLDEPAAALDRAETAHLERLVGRLRDEGSTIVVASHDVEQLLRLADRVVVLRRGRVAAQLDPARTHPDEVLAVMAGHDPSSVPRYQLGRLHSLTNQLSTAGRPTSDDPSAGLDLILTTLGAALGTRWLSLHLVEGDALRLVASVDLPAGLAAAWSALPVATAPDPLRQAVTRRVVGVDADVGAHERPTAHTRLLAESGVAAWWAVPFAGSHGVSGVISVYLPQAGAPAPDELELVNLYAAYAAGSVERDRLLGELTARNRLLEAVRDVLQVLAGPDSLDDGLRAVVQTLRTVAGAERVGLYVRDGTGRSRCRVCLGPDRPTDTLPTGPSAVLMDTAPAALMDTAPAALADAALGRLADTALGSDQAAGVAHVLDGEGGESRLWVRLTDLEPAVALVATWRGRRAGTDERVLFEDAAHSILLALERERTEVARRETSALLRSRQLQHEFLARLSHELRTPLTAIRGYASSLMQPDVDWDAASRSRFLHRIGSESDRLRRLVDGLLDFSTIESGMLRLRPDWVELPLVIDAARACLGSRAAAVEITCAAGLPPVWADHDRLEQVVVNLMDNAVRHNPPGTRVRVEAVADGPDAVRIEVSDDGIGLAVPDEGSRMPGRRVRSGAAGATSGAGLGLSIARGIVTAHRGTLQREPSPVGTRFVVRLPVERDPLVADAAELAEVTDA
ncbi:ATP-binding cassette domain-containing protein [Intrasporangium sp.]|uniref:ATP-binding cassette domain-containing protein n=1 Tax=Intrasporangium sp. TaxID=1925024 RepID=UPI003221D25B